MSVNVFLLLIHTELSQFSVMSLPTANGGGRKPGLLLFTQHTCTLTLQHTHVVVKCSNHWLDWFCAGLE